ncbi:linamarin synthase 1-like [Tripterygium wilfordii]|uniref:linamarin synthase 1-like n=1 Tax=Tripterygium wilfordii TaxID=458696 RepID=UPI0018F80839|nr:linamarin synthase 1-like [Tripterygium wilfordii]
MAKPHAVLLPFPAQGHINPFMHLAKLLHARGFHITFVNTEFNHRRLIRSKGQDFVDGLPDFRFEAIPDGLPRSDHDATQEVWELCGSVQKNCLDPFRELLAKLNSDPRVPPVSGVIGDGVMSFAIKAARELGVPEALFWTASAVGFMCYLHYGEFVRRDENFFKDGTLDSPIDWIPGTRNLQLKDIPSFIRTTDPNDVVFNFLASETQNCLNSSAIILNTFEDLEHEVLEAMNRLEKSPRTFKIGPLIPLLNKCVSVPQNQSKSLELSCNLWKEDLGCLEWLDRREPNSVVYVNYGCLTVMSDQHLKEFAWGLANSKHPFLWIIRPDIVMGDSPILPKEFYEEVKDRGLLVSWCPQDQVLQHPSIGTFVTHCGWNSVTESLCGGGVPLICWPFFAEQQTNCKYACSEWGIGMEVDCDIKRDELTAIVKEIMEEDKGKRLREKAQEWKKRAEEATDVGGSSYNDFDKFLQEVFLPKK